MIKTRVHRDLCGAEHDEEKEACGDLQFLNLQLSSLKCTDFVLDNKVNC